MGRPIKKKYFKGIIVENENPETTVTVDGIDYDITWIQGPYYPGLVTELQTQPWWGNPTLAESFANALGDPTSIFGLYDTNYGPSFLYDEANFGPDAPIGDRAMNSYGWNASSNGGEVVQLSPDAVYSAIRYAVLTSTKRNQLVAYYHNGTERHSVRILKQSGSNKYHIDLDAAGIQRNVGTLVGSEASESGELDITAFDSNDNEYWVTKIYGRRCRLIQKPGGSNYLYENGMSAPWKLTAAIGNVVRIDSN